MVITCLELDESYEMSFCRVIHIFLLKSDVNYGRMTQLRMSGVSTSAFWIADFVTYVFVFMIVGSPILCAAGTYFATIGEVQKYVSGTRNFKFIRGRVPQEFVLSYEPASQTHVWY